MADNPQPLTLTTSNIVGIIQRILLETHTYLSQPAHMVDPNYVFDRLQEAAKFNSNLPGPPQQMAANGADDRSEARAN